MSAKASALRVAVLSGGISAERDISLQSGDAVVRALTAFGHAVTEMDPRATDCNAVDWSAFDVAFIALHGTFGEDGGVQRILEAAGVPFTGSASGASRLAFSKSAAKERWRQFDVRTPVAVLVNANDSAARNAHRAAAVGYPIVVKPDAQGSSLGVSIVNSPAELHTALAACFEYGDFGLLERLVAGNEWTVALIDEQVLPPLCITSTGTFFDYRAKYEDDATRHDFVGGASPAVRDLIGATAQSACRALGTRGAVRVDLIADDCDRPWVLEANTVPGLSGHSLLPKAARQAGLTFAALCERLVRGALRTVKRRAA
ncbi:MAG: D-alanine--D-alanine ligase [Planctomycetaceae bacterium]